MEISLDEATGKIAHFRIETECEARQVIDAIELIRRWLLGEIDDATAVARAGTLDQATFDVATAAWQEWTGYYGVRWRSEGNRLVPTFVA